MPNAIRRRTVVQVRKVRRLVVGVLCAALMFTSVPLTNAAPVDRKTAADPAAIVRHIEQMNLPDMPDTLAAQLRGEGLQAIIVAIVALVVVHGPKLLTALNNCTQNPNCARSLESRWKWVSSPKQQFNALRDSIQEFLPRVYKQLYKGGHLA